MAEIRRFQVLPLYRQVEIRDAANPAKHDSCGMCVQQLGRRSDRKEEAAV